MKNVGILGGTFNPIHLGHTLPAQVVCDHLLLDKLLLIPANIPPHKCSPNVSATDRAKMVEFACEEHAKFSCEDYELQREGFSYTVDTLKALSISNPKTRFFFIMGLDSLLTFTQWHQYQEILTYCHIVVNTRPNYQLDNMNQATKTLLSSHQIDKLKTLKNMPSGGIFLLPHHLADYDKQMNLNISSSEIRHRLLSKQDCQHLLAPKVLAFINKNMLYR